MKKILVTGKNGDLSKAIARWLISRGYEVDNISLRNESWKEKNYTIYDSVVHVAGVVPREGITAEDFYNINSELTYDFAKKVKSDGVLQFIYISSMAVYGLEPTMDKVKGVISKDTPCNPQSDYGKSKLKAEQYLTELESDTFKVVKIRVPSIYGPGKTEYLEQYKHLNNKWGKVPKAFLSRFKSIIYIDNLSELIYLLIKNGYKGIVCPDDGEISAAEICCAISPKLKKSRFLGLLFKTLLKNNDRIRDYYGTICYHSSLTSIFDGKYRVVDLSQAVNKSYEK